MTDARTGALLVNQPAGDDLLIPCGADVDELSLEAPAHVPQVVPAAEIRDHIARDEVLVCTLTALYRVGGTIVWQDGRAGPPGVTVLAWPAARTPSPDEVVAASRPTESTEDTEVSPDGTEEQTPSILTTTTDAEGRFEFSVPIEDGRYTITAGGRGVVADRRITVIPSLRTGYGIGIQSVYGLGVQFITPEGEYLPGLRTVRGASPRFGFRAGGVAGVSLRSPPTIERCLLDPLLERPEADGIHTVLLMATSQLQQVGPLRIVGRHPGREQMVTDLFIPSLADGLRVVTLTLGPSDVRTGSLVIHVVGWAQAVSVMDPESLVLGLRFHPVADDGPGAPDSVTLDGTWFDGDTITIHGLQHGTYTVDLDFGPLTARLSDTMTISDEPAEVSFDLAGLDAGSVIVEVEDRLGRPFRGSAEFDLLRPDGRHVSGHVFMSEPYLLPVVGPGRYVVRMVSANAAEGDHPAARSGEFDVERGEQAVVRLAFDRME